MATHRLHHILQHLRRQAAADQGTDLTDGQLLRRFTGSHEETAFAALVQRHGPLVLGVCRRVLGNSPDTEDVFQATFLVLASRAGAIRKSDSVASWLYGVAVRIARKARVCAARRGIYERRAPVRLAIGDDPAESAAGRELRQVLDEELDRLPEKYRAPLVLCYLEGKSHEEAARQLGWPNGTVCGRLARARDLLRGRLARRGVAPCVGVLATLLAAEAAPAAVPSALAAATVKTAGLLGAGLPATPALPRQVAALADSALRGMVWAKMKIAAVALMALGLLVGGAVIAAKMQTGAPATSAIQNRPSTPAKRRVPVLRDRAGDPLPPQALARLGNVRFRHGAAVNSVALSPDGQTIAGAGADGIRLWRASTGEQLRRIGDNYQGVNSLAWSRDGKILVSGGTDNYVRLWEAATGRQLARLPDKTIWAESVAISPDGTMVAAGSRRGVIRLWNAQNGKLLHLLEKHDTWVSSLAFAPDNLTLASASWDNSIFLWDVATGRKVGQLRGHKGAVQAIAFSGDGKLLASGAGYAGTRLDSKVRLWNVARREVIAAIRTDDDERGVTAVAFAPTGRTFAWGTAAGVIHLGDAARRREIRQFSGHWAGVGSLAFSRDGQMLASGGSDAAIRLWDVASGQQIAGPAGHPGPVLAAAYAADGKTVATAGADRTIRLWDAGTGREIRRLKGHGDEVNAVAFAPDGRTLVSGSGDRTARVWQTATGQEIRRLEGHTETVWSVAFSPDGKWVLTGGNDRTARLWEAATGREHRCLIRGKSPITCVAFSTDRKSLATGTGGGTAFIRLWDQTTGKELRQWTVSSRTSLSARVSALAFSPDGSVLACGGFGEDIQCWDVASGEAVGPVIRCPGPVNSLAFSADGHTLASAGPTLRLWETATAKQRANLPGHRGEVTGIAFSPHGHELVSAGRDGTALVWDVMGRSMKAGPAEAARLSPGQLDRLWTTLASEDAAAAYQAIASLAHSPEQSVPFLKDRVRPVLPVDPRRLSRLMADLESNRFSVRRRALNELSRLGERAVPALRHAFSRSSTPEMRRSASRLLDQARVLSTAQVRAIRAVEVLERMATPEAREVLVGLAGGMPEARMTREARGTLKRLEKN
jgi:RNA polymerase sigma factor (sigma-70 family)